MNDTFVTATITPRIFANAIQEYHVENLYLGSGSGGCDEDVTDEKGRLSNLKRLTLSTSIKVIPSSIGRLKNLKVLCIKNSPLLSELPSSIGELTALEKFELSVTGVSVLPASIVKWKNLQILCIASSPFHELPSSVKMLKSLAFLLVENTLITDIPLWIENLTGIRYLFLSKNRNLSPQAIQTAIDKLKKNLEGLDLSHTKITGIRLPTPNLEYLDLSFSTIPSLLPFIGGLRSIRKLVLENTQISDLPDEIQSLENLEYLNLTGSTQLKILPACVGELTSLKDLYLDETGISVLPDEIGKLTNLERLYIDETEIAALPFSIGDLKSLKVLSAKDTRISYLPEQVQYLTKLTFLGLDGTNITKVPAVILKLTSLKDLYLDTTEISVLPEKIGKLENLERLTLNKTAITTLPASIGNLKRLRVLRLEESGITTLPNHIGLLRNLKELDLSGCINLTVFPHSIINLDLKHLRINDGKISSLPHYIGYLRSLEELDLNGCKNLNALPASIGRLKNLKGLHLERTKISKLPEEFRNLRKLQTLSLGASFITGAFANIQPPIASLLPPPIFRLENLQRLRLFGLDMIQFFETEKRKTFLRYLFEDMLKLVTKHCRSLNVIEAEMHLSGSGWRKNLHYALCLNGAIKKFGSMKMEQLPFLLSNTNRAFYGSGLYLTDTPFIHDYGDVVDYSIDECKDMPIYLPKVAKSDEIFWLLKHFQVPLAEMIQNGREKLGCEEETAVSVEEARVRKKARTLP